MAGQIRTRRQGLDAHRSPEDHERPSGFQRCFLASAPRTAARAAEGQFQCTEAADHRRSAADNLLASPGCRPVDGATITVTRNAAGTFYDIVLNQIPGPPQVAK